MFRVKFILLLCWVVSASLGLAQGEFIEYTTPITPDCPIAFHAVGSALAHASFLIKHVIPPVRTGRSNSKLNRDSSPILVPKASDGFPQILDLDLSEPRIEFESMQSRQEWKGRSVPSLSRGLVKVNGTFITGGGDKMDLLGYRIGRRRPEIFRRTLESLGLSTTTLHNYERKSILSIGEGFGPLVPELVTQGYAIRGLDSWYHQPDLSRAKNGILKEMHTFNQAYGKYLIAGDARTLPLHNESVDAIWSRRLLNNLSFRDNIKVLDEMIRVVKPGGEIRIMGLAILPSFIKRHLKRNYSGVMIYLDERPGLFDGYVHLKKRDKSQMKEN